MRAYCSRACAERRRASLRAGEPQVRRVRVLLLVQPQRCAARQVDRVCQHDRGDVQPGGRAGIRCAASGGQVLVPERRCALFCVRPQLANARGCAALMHSRGCLAQQYNTAVELALAGRTDACGRTAFPEAGQRPRLSCRLLRLGRCRAGAAGADRREVHRGRGCDGADRQRQVRARVHLARLRRDVAL